MAIYLLTTQGLQARFPKTPQYPWIHQRYNRIGMIIPGIGEELFQEIPGQPTMSTQQDKERRAILPEGCKRNSMRGLDPRVHNLEPHLQSREIELSLGQSTNGTRVKTSVIDVTTLVIGPMNAPKSKGRRGLGLRS